MNKKIIRALSVLISSAMLLPSVPAVMADGLMSKDDGVFSSYITGQPDYAEMEDSDTDFSLMAEQVGVEFIRATSQNKTARLVVGRDHDERLFGVFFVESDSLANGAVHIDDLMDHGGGIVGVAGIVYFASFHHQKETLFAV